MPSKTAAEKRKVSYQIQYLMPHRLVVEAQAVLVERAVVADDDGTFQRTPLYQTGAAEHFDFALQRERTRGRYLVDEVVLPHVEGVELGFQIGMFEPNSERDAEVVLGNDRHLRAVLFIIERFIQYHQPVRLVLFDYTGVRERPGEDGARAVRRRRFRAVYLY